MDAIATRKFRCIDAEGKRFLATIRIGLPYTEPAHGNLSACGRCPLSFEPFVAERDVGGVDPFQALCLAIDLGRSVLRAFAASGGRVLDPDSNTPIDLDSPSFAPHLDLNAQRDA